MYAGLSLNGDVTPEDKLQRFIDSALEEIEFVRGPADSAWGARRAELGHPEPFTLEYVEVGNEDWLAGGDKGWNTYVSSHMNRKPPVILALAMIYDARCPYRVVLWPYETSR